MKFIAGLMIILILSLLSITCKKDKAEVTGPEDTKVRDYFPNNIGTHWKYIYYDSLSNNSDTVIVEIVGDTSFANVRVARIWEYKFRTTIERKYVECLGDTIKIYDNLNTLWINTKFIIPFEIGRKWGGDFVTDSSCVEENIPLTVVAGHFSECYVIKETWGALNDYGQIYTWYVPMVGIVKKHHLGWSFGMANYYWELMDYRIE